MKKLNHRDPGESRNRMFLKKEMKQSKLLFLFNIGSVICLVAILVAMGITSIQNHKTDDLNHDRFLLTECTTYFINASSYLTSEVRAYSSTGDKIHSDNYLNELNKNKTREHSLATMKEIGITPDEQAQIEQMMALSQGLIPLEKQSIQDASNGDFTKAIANVLGMDYNNTVLKIHEQRMKFIDSLTTRASNDVNANVRISRTMEIGSVILIIIVIIFQLCCFFINRKRVIQPIIAVAKEMHKLAMGKLSESFPYEPNTSEMGLMIQSILIMRKTLKQYIDDISEKLTFMANKDMSI